MSVSEQSVPLTSFEPKAENAGCGTLEEGLGESLGPQISQRQQRTLAQRMGGLTLAFAAGVAIVLGVIVVTSRTKVSSSWPLASKGAHTAGILAEVKDECAACSDEYSAKSGVIADPTMLGGAMTYEDVQKALHSTCPEHCMKKKEKKKDPLGGFSPVGGAGEDPWEQVSDEVDDGEDLDNLEDGTPCHNAAAEEMCYDLIDYTVRRLLTNDEFYPGLTRESTPAEVQARLHLDRPGICSRPCGKGEEDGSIKGAGAKGKGATAGNGKCKTAEPGDDCFGTIVWVLTEGVFQHPKWFIGLNQASSMEAVQRHLKNNPQKGMPPVCSEPCKQKCHNAVQGEPCWHSVMWAMTEGIGNHSDWFVGLNKESSFLEIQNHYHTDPNTTVHCPKPCDVCHTAVEGERCYSAVQWVLSDGIKKQPDYYKGLNKFSSFQEVQLHLHKNKSESASHCVKPCPATEAEEEEQAPEPSSDEGKEVAE